MTQAAQLELAWPRERQTEIEILAATGNQWKVHCYEGGNRKRVVRVCWIRAATREGAEDAARRLTGKRVVSAFAYQPWEDLVIRRFVRQVP